MSKTSSENETQVPLPSEVVPLQVPDIPVARLFLFLRIFSFNSDLHPHFLHRRANAADTAKASYQIECSSSTFHLDFVRLLLIYECGLPILSDSYYACNRIYC